MSHEAKLLVMVIASFLESFPSLTKRLQHSNKVREKGTFMSPPCHKQASLALISPVMYKLPVK